MSEEVLERLVQEVVALRRRVAHLEPLEHPGLPTNINADTLDGQHGSYYRDILIGMIVPFSGSLGGANNHHPVDTATGEPDLSWHICNGETVNGHATPDLRDRFEWADLDTATYAALRVGRSDVVDVTGTATGAQA